LALLSKVAQPRYERGKFMLIERST
jgi:hypothetical protein